jgi:internalin A
MSSEMMLNPDMIRMDSCPIPGKVFIPDESSPKFDELLAAIIHVGAIKAPIDAKARGWAKPRHGLAEFRGPAGNDSQRASDEINKGTLRARQMERRAMADCGAIEVPVPIYVLPSRSANEGCVTFMREKRHKDLRPNREPNKCPMLAILAVLGMLAASIILRMAAQDSAEIAEDPPGSAQKAQAESSQAPEPSSGEAPKATKSPMFVDIKGEKREITKTGRLELRDMGLESGDIEDLQSTRNIRSLELGLNNITDLATLATLENVSYLDLTGNKVVDASPLSRLAKLKELDLSENPAINLASLSGLGSVRSLGLTNNQISNLAALPELENLTHLYLTSNSISDLGPISSMHSLEALSLGYNQISSLEPVSSLKKLESLYLFNNNISDLGPLFELSNLRSLSLHSNMITDLSPLSELSNLRFLSLRTNMITDLSPLSGLENLEELRLGFNGITDVSALKSLKNLKCLRLQSNPVTDLSPLEELENLEILELTNSFFSQAQIDAHQKSFPNCVIEYD